ncbi:MAG: flagellar biosynthesis anti-sigma factor FlgM [Chitinispirillales bacterium]|jgi:anti-sigma28 factor (negative regulator of flagellin synthesis)|nr:flagellar biosynthesis anti-sigma factor FlgM [Chitinispirillales bacterium]
MLINNISQSIYNELRKLDAGHKAEKEQSANNAGKKSAKQSDSDRSELSSDGKLQSAAKEDLSGIASMVKAQPDIRADKIAEAQLKISSGFYNSEAFAAKLADKMLGV